jgi:hypothetical protein
LDNASWPDGLKDPGGSGMEYKHWVKVEREYPWLWAIVQSSHIEYRTIGFRRATNVIPLCQDKPFSDSRLWGAFGLDGGTLRKSRVFEVKELSWTTGKTPRREIYDQGTTKSDFWSCNYGLYVVVGTIRAYPEGEALTVYKRPFNTPDFRRLF